MERAKAIMVHEATRKRLKRIAGALDRPMGQIVEDALDLLEAKKQLEINK